MQRRDVFAETEGQAGPTKEPDEVEEKEGSPAAPLLTLGLLYTSGWTLPQRQAAIRRRQSGSVRDPVPGDGGSPGGYPRLRCLRDPPRWVEKNVKGLESKYLRETTMAPDEDSITTITSCRLHASAADWPLSRDLSPVGSSPISSYKASRGTTGTSSYVIRTSTLTLKHKKKIQATSRHLHLDGPIQFQVPHGSLDLFYSRLKWGFLYVPSLMSRQFSGRPCTIMSVKCGCKNGAQCIKQLRTVTPTATCKELRVQRRVYHGAHTAAVLSARTLPDDTAKMHTVRFDDDFSNGFRFQFLNLSRRTTPTGVYGATSQWASGASYQRGVAGMTVHGITAKKRWRWQE